jgi:hypothetical protein
MLQIITRKGNVARTIDLHDLPIGDTYCHKVAGPDLFKLLKKLGLPVEPSFGWQQLATVYGNFLADKKDATK